MKAGWVKKYLGEVCESKLGKTLNASTDHGEIRPYLCAVNVKWDAFDLATIKKAPFDADEIKKYSVQKGDLLVCEGGETGRAAIWDKEEPIQYQNALHRIRFKEGTILPRFCLHYLRYLKLSGVLDKEYSHGATILHLVSKSLYSIPIEYPSLPEQQRIVDILDQEFAKIDALKANAEKSLQAAKDLFQATLKKELEPKEGWKTIRMGDFFRITSSKRVFQADWTDKGVPFYRAREIVKLAKYGSVDNDLFITPEMYATYKAKYGVPKVGDVLITGVGTLGVCFLVENENPFYFKDGNVIWLQKEKEISSRYVIYCYQTNDVKEQVHSTQGAVVGTYTIEKANATTIPLPPTMEIQEDIVSRLDVLNDKCNTLQENYQKTLTLCDDLKQSLLRKAFIGEL